MTQPASVTASPSYDDMPLSLVLFRFFWPFWLFRHAGRGDRFVRAAAYRHNRSMRVYLPAYMMRWAVTSTFILAMTNGMDAAAKASFPPISTVFTMFTALCGILLAGGICMMFVTAYVYLYLRRNEC